MTSALLNVEVGAGLAPIARAARPALDEQPQVGGVPRVIDDNQNAAIA